MKKTGLIIALLVASAFAGVSLFLEQLGASDLAPVILLLEPGIIVATGCSGNIHAFSVRAMAIGNFVFYFGLTYSVIMLGDKFGVWEKYSSKPK